ncbi:MAG: ThiF family adenylyltransferase [Candidatus Thorarchaeota archaeon]
MEKEAFLNLVKTKKDKNLVRLSYYDNDRHDRTKRYFGEAINKLQEARILVVGAGAIGNEVIKNLVMLGVKNIILVDHDVVNKSNSNRCVFFREVDHNKIKKVDAVKLRSKELTDTINFQTFATKIQEAPESVWDVDLIIIGVDNDYARYFVNAWLTSTGKLLPVINGAMGKNFIECEVVKPGETACLTCLWQEKFYKTIINNEVLKSCDEYFFEILPKFPAISTFTSIVAGIMVTEATKILANQLSAEEGYLIRLNLENYEYSKGSIMRNPSCVETMCRAGYKDYKAKLLVKKV